MDSEICMAYERCRSRFPTIDLTVDVFTARVKELIAADLPLERLQLEDLFLALACARGDRIAWEYFADDYAPMLHRFAAQACRSMQEREDLAQEIIAGLMSDKGKLRTYTGRGSLAAWLRVAVSHAAIDRFRKTRMQLSLDDIEGHGHEPAAAPSRAEEFFDDARWGPVLSKILAEQIRALPARDRLLLGLYYLQGVSLKSIGRQFGVHEATASRWLDSLRHGIRKRIEKELRSRHGLRPREIEALWRWISEQESFSLRQLIND